MEAVFFLRNLIVVMALLLWRRTDEAEKNAEAMLREGPDDPFARIAMALVLAIRGEREKSLSMLTPEVEATAAADLRHDWFLDGVRSSPEVRAALEEIREGWEAFRE